MPLNYYDKDISHETVNMVRINYDNGTVTKLKTFGQNEIMCPVDLAAAAPDLYAYKGDVVIRKFPYGKVFVVALRRHILTD